MTLGPAWLQSVMFCKKDEADVCAFLSELDDGDLRPPPTPPPPPPPPAPPRLVLRGGSEVVRSDGGAVGACVLRNGEIKEVYCVRVDGAYALVDRLVEGM